MYVTSLSEMLLTYTEILLLSLAMLGKGLSIEGNERKDVSVD